MMRLLASLLLVPLSAHAETCRFNGTTSYDGRLAVQADAMKADDLLTLDITVEFTIHAWMTDYRYLSQEITTWSVSEGLGAAPRSIAVNQRSLAGGEVKRQQWDVFTRNGPQLEGHRIQAKYFADLQRRHPGFASHWSPASFGQPWLADFQHAGAERRPDLDLSAAGVKTPLAFAFYWSRFLSWGGGPVSLVLPGFKRDKQAWLNLAPATADEGGQRWSTPLQHPALETRPASLVVAWVSLPHYLSQLHFDIHTSWAAGQVILHATGCQGVQISPG